MKLEYPEKTQDFRQRVDSLIHGPFLCPAGARIQAKFVGTQLGRRDFNNQAKRRVVTPLHYESHINATDNYMKSVLSVNEPTLNILHDNAFP